MSTNCLLLLIVFFHMYALRMSFINKEATYLLFKAVRNSMNGRYGKDGTEGKEEKGRGVGRRQRMDMEW